MKRLYNVAILAAAAALGCSGDPGTMMNPGPDGGPGGGNPDLLAVGDGPVQPPGDLAMMSAGYPAGPYGNTVGDTFPPLVWEGYEDDAADVVANTKPFGPYSADAARRSGRAYAMVHISDFI